MLHGFLKPAWQSKSAEKRCLAIIKMDESDDDKQGVLAQLAVHDPSNAVRLECIKKLSQATTLFSLSQSPEEDVIKTAAKEALAIVIGPNSSIEKSQLEILLEQQPAASAVVIQLAPIAELRHKLLEQLDDEQLAELIANVSYAETRYLIAEKLEATRALELARNNLKGKDKKAERVIRNKLELIRNTQKKSESNQLAAEDLLKNMAFIATHSQWRSEFKGRFELYSARWDELEPTTSSDTIERFKLMQQQAQIKVDQQTLIEHASNQQVQLVQNLESYCGKTLAKLDFENLKQEQLSINTVLADAIATWLELNQQRAAQATLTNQFLQAERALEWLVSLISDNPLAAIKKSYWPTGYPPLNAYQEVKERHQQQQKESASSKAAEKLVLDKLHQRINRLQGTTKQGDLRKARHELAAVTKAVEKQSGKERSILDDRLSLAKETVCKMEDWHVFATEPKYLELCAEMEALVHSKTHEDALAGKIAALQTKWKSLGHSSAADDHWPRFKAASDKAYEPCTVFFAKRKEAQKSNLQKREPLISQMSSLLEGTDWDNAPDYKEIEHSLRNIDNQWREIKDVERHAGQRQWNKLKAIKDKIYVHLDSVYDANIELKKNIVRQVEQLLVSDLLENSIEKLKLHQSRWKQIGVTRRKEDQEQWRLFKRASDAVYEKISLIRTDRRAEEDGQIQSYKDIIQKINQLAKNAKTLVQVDTELEEHQQQYQSLPPLPKELPEKLVERLTNDYQRALTNASNGRDRLIVNAQNEQFDLLHLKAKLCGELELAIDSKAKQTDIDALFEKINNVELHDKSWDKALQKRMSKADNKDKTKANQQRQLLCIELEILKGVESPSEDKSLRMSTQLERMKDQGFGAPAQDKNTTLKELEVNWCVLEGAEPKLQDVLQKRFDNAISHT